MSDEYVFECAGPFVVNQPDAPMSASPETPRSTALEARLRHQPLSPLDVVAEWRELAFELERALTALNSIRYRIERCSDPECGVCKANKAIFDQVDAAIAREGR